MRKLFWFLVLIVIRCVNAMPNEISFVVESYATMDGLDEGNQDRFVLYDLNGNNPKITCPFTSSGTKLKLIDSNERYMIFLHTCQNHSVFITIYLNYDFAVVSVHQFGKDGAVVWSGVGTIEKCQKVLSEVKRLEIK